MPSCSGSPATLLTITIEQVEVWSLSSTRSTAGRPARTPKVSLVGCGGAIPPEQSVREVVSWFEAVSSPSGLDSASSCLGGATASQLFTTVICGSSSQVLPPVRSFRTTTSRFTLNFSSDVADSPGISRTLGTEPHRRGRRSGAAGVEGRDGTVGQVDAEQGTIGGDQHPGRRGT